MMDNIKDNVVSTSDFQTHPFACSSGQETIYSAPTILSSEAPCGSKTEDFSVVKYHQNPRKKRSKLVKIDSNYGVRSSGGGSGVTKPKYTRKPDPSAPKITNPCTECGKKFWSWKALFGHMRCHPDRQWRGINPPPNYRRQQQQVTQKCCNLEAKMTVDDHEVATCLLMLANGPTASESPTVTTACNVAVSQGMLETDNGAIVVRRPIMGCGDVDHADAAGPSEVNCSKFECSSCKKVFGSHQALGGHRASHKNVKGCFANTRNGYEEHGLIGYDHGNDGEVEVKDGGEDKMMVVYGHKCSICLRIFSSGQALGGHKRCHWERGDEPSGLTQALSPFVAKEGCGLDLNLPAPVDDDSSCSYSSGLALDLSLGL